MTSRRSGVVIVIRAYSGVFLIETAALLIVFFPWYDRGSWLPLCTAPGKNGRSGIIRVLMSHRVIASSYARTVAMVSTVTTHAEPLVAAC